MWTFSQYIKATNSTHFLFITLRVYADLVIELRYRLVDQTHPNLEEMRT